MSVPNRLRIPVAMPRWTARPLTRGIVVSLVIHTACLAAVIAWPEAATRPVAIPIPMTVALVRPPEVAPDRPAERTVQRTAVPHPPLPSRRKAVEAPVRKTPPAAGPASAPSTPQPRPARSTAPSDVAQPAPLDSNGRRTDGTLPPRMGRASPMEDYRARVQAWLRLHRRYPATADGVGKEGRVVVRFVVDRAGRVLRKRVVRGSGSALLDRAALEVVRLAEPLPAMPASFPYQHLELAYVMEFLQN